MPRLYRENLCGTERTCIAGRLFFTYIFFRFLLVCAWFSLAPFLFQRYPHSFFFIREKYSKESNGGSFQPFTPSLGLLARLVIFLFTNLVTPSRSFPRTLAYSLSRATFLVTLLLVFSRGLLFTFSICQSITGAICVVHARSLSAPHFASE